MSVSEPTAQVDLYSSVGSVELSLVAADFRPVANGIGRLSAQVAPGIYQVVARAGPVVDRRLITLSPGETYRDDQMAVRFPSPAPISDTTTSHEYHQAAAEQAAGILRTATGPPSGLVLVVRDVRGTSGPPLELGDLACFSLLNNQFNEVVGLDQAWQLQSPEAIATFSGRFAAGGYALRTDPTRITSANRRPASRQVFDQSLWLSDNWLTIVFITTGPGGPETATASVHMTDLGYGWNPYETDIGLALELANWGLREGRSVVPDDLLNLLLGGKFVNPMFGIVGAHSMLLRSEVDWDQLDTVLTNLGNLVPGHPDVVALRWMAGQRRAAAGNGSRAATPVPARTAPAPAAASGGATWPPTLLASYRALIGMDAIATATIADGSPAELAAPNLLVQGIWTSWTPVTFAPPSSPPPPPPPPGGEPIAPPVAPPPQEVIGAIGGNPAALDQVPLDDPATTRVVSYLSALAVLEGRNRQDRFARLTPQEIALSTTLPVATVERSLSRIGMVIPPIPPTPPAPPNPPPADPTPDPNPGGDFSIGMAALVAAIAVLLLGGVGVTAWCAGDQSCPLRISPASPAVTLEPTLEPPTHEPTPEITPAPTAQITPEPTPIVLAYDPLIRFDPVIVGSGPTRSQFVVRANHELSLTFVVPPATEPVFSADSTCPKWEESGGGALQCQIVVTFEPAVAQAYTGFLEMHVEGEPEPRQIGLSGDGITAVILSLPGELPTFDQTTVGFTSSRNLIFTANAPVNFTYSIDIPASYEVLAECTWTVMSDAEFECLVPVTFSPDFAGQQDGMLFIVPPGTDVGSGPVTLRGTGLSNDSPP